MIPTFRTARFGAAVLAAATIAILTGCTTQPTARPASGTTAQPASSQRFTCPTRDGVAALTAVPFSSGTASATSCTYSTAAGTDPAVSVEVRPAAASGTTLAALRSEAISSGAVTSDVPRLSFDAFTTATAHDCTAWFPDVDGALTSVTARRSDGTGAKACGDATAVATLTGAGAQRTSARTVAVVADDDLLGTSTADAAWPWRIGRTSGVRIDRVVGSGTLRPRASGSLTDASSSVQTDSAAVVFVTGTSEAGASRLAVLSAMTADISAAAARAPRARLIVVGPVAERSTDPVALEDLRGALQSAAGIAGARYVQPAVGESLGTVADQVSTALAGEGIDAR